MLLQLDFTLFMLIFAFHCFEPRLTKCGSLRFASAIFLLFLIGDWLLSKLFTCFFPLLVQEFFKIRIRLETVSPFSGEIYEYIYRPAHAYATHIVVSGFWI